VLDSPSHPDSFTCRSRRNSLPSGVYLVQPPAALPGSLNRCPDGFSNMELHRVQNRLAESIKVNTLEAERRSATGHQAPCRSAMPGNFNPLASSVTRSLGGPLPPASARYP
jgi:hypothetical protein